MTTDRLFPGAHSAVATAGGFVDGGGFPSYSWSRRQGKQSCVVSYHASGGRVPAGEYRIRWHGGDVGVEWPLATSRLAAVKKAASC